MNEGGLTKTMQDWRENYVGMTSTSSIKCRQPTFTKEFLSSVSAGSRSIPISDDVTRPSGTVRSTSNGAQQKPVKLYACADCSYSTDRKNNLKRHRLTMHERSARTLECCDQLFADKSTLREHVTREHGAGTGYACMHCGRRFGRRALMRRHVAVHEAQQQYQHRHMSDIDGKRESPSDKDVGSPAVDVEDAGDTFELQHQPQQRPEKTGYENVSIPTAMPETTGKMTATPAPARRFQCQFCEYSTEHKSNLDRHRRRHIGCGSDWTTDPVPILSASKRSIEKEIRYPNHSAASLQLLTGPKVSGLFPEKSPSAKFPYRLDLERKLGRTNKPDCRSSTKDVSNEDNSILGTNSAFQLCPNSVGRSEGANLDQFFQQLSAGKYPTLWHPPAVPCTSRVNVQPFDEIIQNRLAIQDSRFFNSFAIMLLRSVQRSRQIEELKRLMEMESGPTTLNCNYCFPWFSTNEHSAADAKTTHFNMADCFAKNTSHLVSKTENREMPKSHPEYEKWCADVSSSPADDLATRLSRSLAPGVNMNESSFEVGNSEGETDNRCEAEQPRCRLLPLLHTCRVCSVTFVSQLQLKMHCDVTHASDEATARQAIRPITTLNQQQQQPPHQQQQQKPKLIP